MNNIIMCMSYSVVEIALLILQHPLLAIDTSGSIIPFHFWL